MLLLKLVASVLLLGAMNASASCHEAILRIKNAPPGRSGQIVEFPIDQITYIHEVPNPKRSDHPPHFFDDLMKDIKENGFQELYAVPLVRMPNGVVYCAGHHRTEAMKRLGEKTVPAIIYDWNKLSSGLKRIAILEFPEIFRKYLKDLHEK